MITVEAKKRAGIKAALQIESGMKVGLGSGSTVFFFIEKLGELCQKGLKITAAASSMRSENQAKSLGIEILPTENLLSLDVMVDGADEIDPQRRMIKGGGGALLREKLLAVISKRRVIIVDPSKCVEHLGKFPLPVEVVPFIANSTRNRLEELGYKSTFRRNEKNEFFITDNGNYIIDIPLRFPCNDPEKDNAQIKKVTGVIETGFFFNLVDELIVGEN